MTTIIDFNLCKKRSNVANIVYKRFVQIENTNYFLLKHRIQRLMIAVNNSDFRYPD